METYLGIEVYKYYEILRLRKELKIFRKIKRCCEGYVPAPRTPHCRFWKKVDHGANYYWLFQKGFFGWPFLVSDVLYWLRSFDCFEMTQDPETKDWSIVTTVKFFEVLADMEKRHRKLADQIADWRIRNYLLDFPERSLKPKL